MAVLETRGLKKHFGRIRAVDGIDLTSTDGELLAILGPSGSGKSTLMRMVAGLEEPSAGDILVDGRSIVGIPPKRRNVAMVFQSFALYPHMSVLENIRFPLVARRVPAAEQREKIDWVTGILDIGDLLERRPTRLSGGQMQRVALARALVRDPELFVFDEPLSSLDAQIRSQARGELRELHDRTQITTLYVTHDQLEALGLADRVAVVHNGCIQQLGTPRTLYEDPGNLFVAGFIGDPPMNRLDLGDNVILGVRPEHLLLEHGEEDPGEVALRLEVELEHLEFLGAEWLIYAAVCAGVPETGRRRPRVIARLRQAEPPSMETGQRRTLVVRRANARYFDAESGERRSAPSGVAA
ncbi:ABC transporter ATP-binding protein [Arhodomonas aquaeolei]|nr:MULTISPECIES: ABC transporter ATP-binding protein [Arhodomonas]MCS4504656.1 ABC transporter ATP-binding protein [Arhodomonas aquaeolei]